VRGNWDSAGDMEASIDISKIEKAEKLDAAMTLLFNLYMREGFTPVSMEEYLAEPAADY
jgi:hypothetical protein